MSNKPATKTISYISRSPPYGKYNAHLCLDMVLAGAVFEQNINYIFMGDGVFQLVKDQSASKINSKTLGKALETLELYGVEKVWVDKDSLSTRNLTNDDLLIDVAVADSPTIADLIHSSDVVFNL